jgi:TolB-like protein
MKTHDHHIFNFALFLLSLLTMSNITAQTTVALGEFNNRSDKFYLDQWEQSVPDFLQDRLSKPDQLIILERRKLKAVLEEQALALTGLTDSSEAREIGNLLQADYLVYGSINEIDGEYRIDASIVKVSTGQTETEKVVGPDRDHLSEMIDLLGNNILFKLTGEGGYRERQRLGRSSTLYFAGATAGLAVGTIIATNRYKQFRDDYRNNTELDQFDPLYDKANRTKKISVGLASLTGAALFGTIYFWIRDRSPSEIYAQNRNILKTVPYLTYSEKNEIIIGIQINY